MGLAVVVAPATMRVVTTASSLPHIATGAPTDVEGVMSVTVAAETLTHRDRGALPTSLWLLVD